MQAQTTDIVPGSKVDYAPTVPSILGREHTGRTNFKKDKPLPTITVSEQGDDDPSAGLPNGAANLGRSPQPDATEVESKEQTEARNAEEEAKRKKRLEDEKLAKKKERERWRKSEQDFTRLPHTPLSAAASLSERPRPENGTPEAPPLHSSRPSSPEIVKTSPPPKLEPLRPASPPHDEKKDRELAAQIQAQLAREVAEEDERKALEIAASLQRQWEAEDEKATPEKIRQQGRPIVPSDESSSEDESSSSSINHPPPALPPGGRSPRPQLPNTVPYGPSYYQGPSPVNSPPVPAGPVAVTNVNSGNYSNTHITDSYNNNSRIINARRSVDSGRS